MEIKTIVEKIRKSIHSHDFLFSFQNIIQGIWKIWRVCFLKTIYILDPVDDSTKSKYILSDYIYGEKKIISIRFFNNFMSLSASITFIFSVFPKHVRGTLMKPTNRRPKRRVYGYSEKE